MQVKGKSSLRLLAAAATLVVSSMLAASSCQAAPAYGNNYADFPAAPEDPRLYMNMDMGPAEQQFSPSAQMMEPSAPKNSGGFSMHLRELGKSGLDSARRAYQDARPALSNIRGDLNGAVQRVRSNPHVAKVVEATRPHVMNVISRTQPIVDKSGKKINELASNFQQRIQQRRANQQQQQRQNGQFENLEPGSVYPMRPEASY